MTYKIFLKIHHIMELFFRLIIEAFWFNGLFLLNMSYFLRRCNAFYWT